MFACHACLPAWLPWCVHADLYIPAMAFITFVLASGLLKGTRAQFHPEVLVSVASSVLLAQALEVGVLKAALASLSADVGVTLRFATGI